MEVLIQIWLGIFGYISVLLVMLSAPLVIVATIIACVLIQDKTYDMSLNRPSPAMWRKRMRRKLRALIIFAGFLLLNATFLLYFYYPWGLNPWNLYG